MYSFIKTTGTLKDSYPGMKPEKAIKLMFPEAGAIVKCWGGFKVWQDAGEFVEYVKGLVATSAMITPKTIIHTSKEIKWVEKKDLDGKVSWVL